MKQLAVFIGLNVLEILAVVLIPYWVARRMVRLEWFCDLTGADGSEPRGMLWVMGIVLVAIIGIVFVLTFIVVLMNWEWAGKLI